MNANVVEELFVPKCLPGKAHDPGKLHEPLVSLCSGCYSSVYDSHPRCVDCYPALKEQVSDTVKCVNCGHDGSVTIQGAITWREVRYVRFVEEETHE